MGYANYIKFILFAMEYANFLLQLFSNKNTIKLVINEGNKTYGIEVRETIMYNLTASFNIFYYY